MSETITDPREAAARLRDGALVGVPTETVYGLAADAENETAVRRVFAVKGRPLGHPLIVHLDQPENAQRWAEYIDPKLAELMSKHWPGPLTVIVPKAQWVPDVITGGQPTVALRVPDHRLTRDVLAELSLLKGGPAAVVAPSANLFGQVSPTRAEHVLDGLGDRLEERDAVLDGGPCRIGVESTVVAAVAGELRVLRPGFVEIDEIARTGADHPVPAAPGTLAAHYAPAARVVVMEDEAADDGLLRQGVGDEPDQVGLIAPDSVTTPQGWVRLAAPTDTENYAQELYAALRAGDDYGLATVVAVAPPPGGLGDAVRDRLFRAATGSQPL